MEKSYVMGILESNGVNEEYFKAMGGREIEGGGNEWWDIVEEVGEDKIMEFIDVVENELNIMFV
jgi:hypothetical protein